VTPPDDPGWQPGHKPGLRDALLLLAASAACAGLYYWRLGEIGPSLFYGALTGCGLAAIGAEFYKFIRSYRAEKPGGDTVAAVKSLVGQSFQIGFVSTFRRVASELFKLVGVKLLVSAVIAVSALFIAGQRHWF
jgi:hypothetical protein